MYTKAIIPVILLSVGCSFDPGPPAVRIEPEQQLIDEQKFVEENVTDSPYKGDVGQAYDPLIRYPNGKMRTWDSAKGISGYFHSRMKDEVQILLPTTVDLRKLSDADIEFLQEEGTTGYRKWTSKSGKFERWGYLERFDQATVTVLFRRKFAIDSLDDEIQLLLADTEDSTAEVRSTYAYRGTGAKPKQPSVGYLPAIQFPSPSQRTPRKVVPVRPHFRNGKPVRGHWRSLPR